MVDNINHIKLNHSTLFLREDGIIEVKFRDDVVLSLEDCEELLFHYGKLSSGKKVPILHLIGKYMNVTKEAREFSASEEGLKYSLAEAFVFDSLPHRIIANFYLNVNKPCAPTKFFKTKKEAEVWLKKFLKK